MTSSAALKQTVLSTTPLENQRAASNPSASVWVNASAGSGKTTVLTARVTRLLLSGVSPEKILCLTYTRAGAAEMTNRITAQFSKWVSCDDKTLDDDLDRLQNDTPEPGQRTKARRLFAEILSCPGGLRIRTIHSFCQEILSRFPIEAGLPPHFGLIEGQDLDVLKSDILDDLLREAADKPDSELAHALAVLIAEQGEFGFTRMLQDALKECGRLMQSPQKLAARTRQFLDLEPTDTPHSFLLQAVANIPDALIRPMAAWLAEGTPSHQERSRDLLSILDKPATERVAYFNDYYSLFLTQKHEPLSPTKVASKNVRAAHPEIDDIAGREAARLISVLQRIEAASIAQVTKSVLIFGSLFAARLTKTKAARAVLDYDDLVQHTERLLTSDGIGAWILYKLDNGIDHILVDEAQDTSRAQWNIVEALTTEFYAGRGIKEDENRTLFVVGDEKQSIFSFQNADPEAFLSLREKFAQKLSHAGKPLNRVPLHISFRSAPAILDAVDAVFAPDSVRQGVSEEIVKHSSHPNRDGSTKIGRVEVWPLLKLVKDEEKSDGTWIVPTEHEEEHDPQAELAQQIAAKIKGWTVRHAILPGKNAPIKPGDIMILLRRRGRFADLMVRALKSAGVPVTGIDRMHLISQLAVMDLLAMLRFVLLPEDDLNLAALLRSPLLGISEEQLMELAMGRASGETLWQRVKTSSACTSIYDYLAERLNEADFSTPFEFLAHILSTPCPANPTSGRKALWARLGEEAIDPIEELLNAAQSFGRGHAPSLQNFLHWLTQADAEIKRELDRADSTSEGQVRIMTVHASKGLEAPIVFLPDTASVPRSTDIPKFQWSDDAPLFFARTPRFGAALHVWQQARDRQMEEYRRLFYVALTRAANRLYICGWQGRNDGEGSWYNLAASALRPLHNDTANVEEGTAPEIIFTDPEIAAAPVEQRKTGETQTPALPAWATQKIVLEAIPARSAPSASYLTNPDADISSATPDAAFARGRIIHRLLQSLPDIPAATRAAAIERFLSQPRHNLTQAQRDEITDETNALLSDSVFASLFGPDSRAEIGLAGSLDGIAVHRQIDRLCLRGDEVWIVDYKTNRPPPVSEADIPEAYRHQLSEYRLLLRGIYPDKRVRCFLLWTYAPRLMEISF